MARIIEHYEIYIDVVQSEKTPMAMMEAIAREPDFITITEPEMQNGYFEFMTSEGHNIFLMADKVKLIKSVPVYKEK